MEVSEVGKVKENKRVAKNTAVLFLRMSVLMIVNLYAVRVLLSALGVVDYGIFQTVAGVVTSLSCLSSVLSISTQRFYSYVVGRGEQNLLPQVFSASVIVNTVLVGVIFLLLETIGLYFLNTQLSIPVERIVAANVVFQCSLIVFLFSVIQIPYMAAVVAHEDMGLYAVITTMECIGRLVAAMLISCFCMDALEIYGIGLVIVAILIFCGYFGFAMLRYKECHFCKVRETDLYRRITSFSAWTLFGSLANVGLFQGNTLLLNVFFGPVINAAYGVALQINNAFVSLCNSVVLAFRPLMIRTTAQKDYERLEFLLLVSSKFIFYLLLLTGGPLFAIMPYVLRLWLGEEILTPEMVTASRLIIIYIIVMMLHHPITIVMQAEGLVKQYHLAAESALLLCLPLSYVLFRSGAPAEASYVSMIVVSTISHVVRLLVLRRYCSWFSLSRYVASMFSGIGIRRDERELLKQVVNRIKGGTKR